MRPSGSGHRASYYICHNDYIASLTSFSGVNEKDINFIRRALKATRFEQID